MRLLLTLALCLFSCSLAAAAPRGNCANGQCGPSVEYSYSQPQQCGPNGCGTSTFYGQQFAVPTVTLTATEKAAGVIVVASGEKLQPTNPARYDGWGRLIYEAIPATAANRPCYPYGCICGCADGSKCDCAARSKDKAKPKTKAAADVSDDGKTLADLLSFGEVPSSAAVAVQPSGIPAGFQLGKLRRVGNGSTGQGIYCDDETRRVYFLNDAAVSTDSK